MADTRRSRPMPVKHWSFAGLILTYWCNARCASCYFSCSPQRGEEMSVEQALDLWRQLAAGSPHGCRVHLSGGEPFGNWDRLIEICSKAFEEGLSSPLGRGPLEKVETNAFWALDEKVVRRRLNALDKAGMRKLAISSDPYHQQFVPIEQCRLAARVAEEILGPGRVQVRWRDWLQDGFDTAGLTEPERMELFARYAGGNRDRFNGRAAMELAVRGMAVSAMSDTGVSPVAVQGFSDEAHGRDGRGTHGQDARATSNGRMERKAPQDFADKNCREALLRSRHVHIDASGLIVPGTCAGIVLGQASDGIENVWRRLGEDHDSRPIVGVLSREGPSGLLGKAREHGFVPLEGYLSKCHLCWHIRRHLAGAAPCDELGPDWFYRE